MSGGIRKFFISTLILTFVLQIVGCGPKETGDKPKKVPIKVAFWGSPEEIEIMTTTIKNWQRFHPDIQVKLEHIPFGGYISKILTEIAGRAAPDIIAAEVNMFVSFAAKDIFMDLNSFIEKDPIFKLGEFFPEVVDRYKVDGKLYGIPRDTAPMACIYYNKKLFDEAGISYPADNWNWNDLLDKAKKLTVVDKDGKVIQYGFYSDMWPNFVLSNRGKIVDNVKKPTKCLLDMPESIEGLQFMVDLAHKYKVSPTPTTFRNLGLGVIQYKKGQGFRLGYRDVSEKPQGLKEVCNRRDSIWNFKDRKISSGSVGGSEGIKWR